MWFRVWVIASVGLAAGRARSGRVEGEASHLWRRSDTGGQLTSRRVVSSGEIQDAGFDARRLKRAWQQATSRRMNERRRR